MSLECIEEKARESGGRIIETEGSVRTVEQASKRTGVEVGSIIKTLLFVGQKGVYAVVLPGDRRASIEKLELLLGEKGLRLARPSEVRELTGYEAGGLPPFCLGDKVSVLLDFRVLERGLVVGGGGSTRRLVEVPSKAILELNRGARVVDASSD
ncbi:MAG: YbaK/EbsC family protein [Fervidicoccaceae archaeon]